MRPFGSGICKVRKVGERHALLVGRAHDDIDQINAVAHLRDRRAGHHACSSPRRAPASSGRAAVPVLVDADPHHPGRLHPVEIDPSDPAFARA